MLKVHQDKDSLQMKRQKLKEYDKEIPQSHTVDQPMAPQGRAK